jgi:hypothetical protein
VKVVFTARAERSIEKADAWWREHREKNPELFAEEFIEATRMLRIAPHIGKRALDVELQGVRFVVFRRPKGFSTTVCSKRKTSSSSSLFGARAKSIGRR